MLSFMRALFDSDLTAATALDAACAAHPDEPLFHVDAPLPYAGMGEGPITPRRLLDFVNRMGNVLRAAGLRRYDRVAIYKTNSPDYFFVALAVIKAGGVAVPINGGMSLDDLRYYLGHTGSKLLVTDAALFAERIKSVAALPMVETWIFPEDPPAAVPASVNLATALPSASPVLEPVVLDSDSDVLIAHTSGTTGFPKGVLTTSGSVVHGIRTQRTVGPMSEGARVVLTMPFNHLVSQFSLYSCLLVKMPVWLVSRFDARRVLELIDEQKINIFAGFPDKYLAMYEEGIDRYDLSSIRLWVSVADSAHDVHMRAFSQKGTLVNVLGRRVRGSLFMDTLGSSEVGGPALTRFVHPFSKPDLSRNIGRTSPFGPKVKIVDEHGAEVPRGTVGRIMVTGPTLFKGYWNAHDKLHGVVRDGWWWTGDVGYRDRAGRHHHLDRDADVVRTKRGPVYTLLIEEVLMAHPDVSEVAVFGVPHPEHGEAPVAALYARPGHVADAEACQAWANERVDRCAMSLQRVFVVSPSEIPRGLTGKVLKRVLRDRYASAFSPRPPDRSLGDFT